MKVRILCVICLCLCFLGNNVLADQGQEFVRAKIGIKLRSRGKNLRAKAFEKRSRIGDRIQIYVMPEPDPAYIYVIRRDQDSVIRVNSQERTRSNENFLWKQSYKIDALFELRDRKSTQGYITIICSPKELPEIDEILSVQDGAYEKWLEYEQKLEEAQIDMSAPISKPLNIGGTARELASGDFFLQKLPVTSGKSFVVKRYEFHIKK